MRLDITACLIEIELRQRRVVGTGACYQHVVHRRWQVVEEPLEELEVSGVKGRSAQGIDFTRGTLKVVRIATGEDYLRALRTCQPGRFESDASASADHENGLTQEFRLPLDMRGASDSAH